jgi:hypothetical protein
MIKMAAVFYLQHQIYCTPLPKAEKEIIEMAAILLFPTSDIPLPANP